MECGLGKVVFRPEVILGRVVSDAHPIIEGLERQVDILFGLEFKDGEAGGVVDGEDVGDVAIDAGDRRYLAIRRRGAQGGVHGFQVEADLGFQPGFGMAGVKRIEFIGRVRGAKAGHFG